MSDWYEVFDDERVQQLTRLRVGRVSTAAVAALAVGLGALPLAVLYAAAPLAVAAAILLGLGGVLAVLGRQMLRLRRVTWCLKVSVHRVVGYDYARRKTTMPWTEVERLDVDADGLLVVGAPQAGRPGPVLRVPTLFPEFAALSHRLAEYAEAHGVPVCVDGRPWQLLDLHTIYPFLPSAPPPAQRRLPGPPDPV